MRYLVYVTSIFVHHFIAIAQLSYSLETPNSGQNLWFLVPCDIEIWHMALKNNKAHFYATSSLALCVIS